MKIGVFRRERAAQGSLFLSHFIRTICWPSRICACIHRPQGVDTSKQGTFRRGDFVSFVEAITTSLKVCVNCLTQIYPSPATSEQRNKSTSRNALREKKFRLGLGFTVGVPFTVTPVWKGAVHTGGAALEPEETGLKLVIFSSGVL